MNNLTKILPSISSVLTLPIIATELHSSYNHQNIVCLEKAKSNLFFGKIPSLL